DQVLHALVASIQRFNDSTVQRFGCGFAALRSSRLCGFPQAILWLLLYHAEKTVLQWQSRG
ncbi:MAG: hypothetical protein AAB466_02280, partial [Verrucomicrobiota bacterium]